MIKAVTKNPVGAVNGVMLGLSAENWRRLRAGKPILVKLRELYSELPDITVTITGGDTESDLMDDFRAMAPIKPNPHDTTPAEES